MLIPLGPPESPAAGYPTLYPTRLRAYGAAPPFDEVRGCPALYKARYIDNEIVRIAEHGSPLEFGGAVHEALFHMEQHAVGPDEALRETWPAALGLDRWAEAVDLLEHYLERGGPMARYATLAVEVELFAELYVDDDFGPIWFGGIIDWLGVDTNLTQQLHLADYKTNARPLSREDVVVDQQLRGYEWLVHRNWKTTLAMPGAPSIIAHMDGLRWNDVEVQFTNSDREEWQSWAIAAARSILRDDTAKEVISEGCRWCPRKLQCGAYSRLPGDAEAIRLRATGKSPEELWGWRRDAAQAVALLKKGIDDVDEILRSKAEQEGPFVVDDQQWFEEDDEKDRVDLERLHNAVGDVLFYDAVSVTKKTLDQLRKAHPDLAPEIDRCVDRIVVGRSVTRKKVKPE